MNRTVKDFLRDMLNSIDEVEEFTKGLTFEEFVKDRRTVNAVIRSLEVLGEAARRIPEETRGRFPHVPWRGITGMRDKLIHGNNGVSLRIVWETAREQVPPLKPLLEQMSAVVDKEDL